MNGRLQTEKQWYNALDYTHTAHTHIYTNNAVTDLTDTVKTTVWNYNIEQNYNRKASQNRQFNVLTQTWHNS